MSDKVLMPRKLTAENGAKKLLSGEFHLERTDDCPECEGDGYTTHNGVHDEICGLCEGEGSKTIKTPIPWTTIKEIYTKAVEHFGLEAHEITEAGEI